MPGDRYDSEADEKRCQRETVNQRVRVIAFGDVAQENQSRETKSKRPR
jgi:hypothetical protein